MEENISLLFVRVITSTSTTSITPVSKWLNGVGIIFTNINAPGIDQYKELVQKHGGEVLPSWLSYCSFEEEWMRPRKSGLVRARMW